MKFLFICTHNRCRSILSEAIMNHMSDGSIEARSAGSQPSGQVHPLSLQYLQEVDISTKGLKSQSWDEFEDWQPDVVITVCDSAAGESCPVWFEQTKKIHWGLKDPSKIDGSDATVAAEFRTCINTIKQRTQAIINLNLTHLAPKQLHQTLDTLILNHKP